MLVGMGLAMLRVALVNAPLGYDESVYASETRSFVTGVPTLWAIYRPPGLPLVGLTALPLGLSDASLRIAAAACGLLALGLVWGLARLLWGRLAAGIALVVVMVSPVVLDQIVVFHNDAPSAAPVLALMVLLWWQFEVRERPNALLVAAGPLAAAAFYLRYGALALLVGVALTAIFLWGKRLLRAARLVGASLVVTVALFLPHIVDAVIRTGSPLGIVRAAVTQVDTTTPLHAALQYLRWMPSQLAGIAGVVFVVVAGLAAAYAAAESIGGRRLTAPARRLVWLLLPAVVAGLGTVIVSHPEARYVLTPVVLVEIAGAGSAATAVVWLAKRLAQTQPRAASLVVPAILVVLVVVLALDGRSWIRREVRHKGDQWLLHAGRAIATNAGGPCTLASSIGPILGWYSGCAPITFVDPTNARMPAQSGRPVYVVFTTLDDTRGVKPQVLARYRNELNLVEIANFGQDPLVATVYRVQP